MPEGPWMEGTSSTKRERPQEDLPRLLRRSRRAAVFGRQQRKVNSLRSSTVSRGSTSASILLFRNCSSYRPSPRPRSHPPTSIAAPHMAGRMIAHARRRVHQPRSRRARTWHVPARKFRISPEIGTCADAAGRLVVSSRNGGVPNAARRTALLLPGENSETVVPHLIASFLPYN